MSTDIETCLYVGLAEQERCDLVTGDDRLVRNLEVQFPFIKHISTLRTCEVRNSLADHFPQDSDHGPVGPGCVGTFVLQKWGQALRVLRASPHFCRTL